MQQGTHKGSLHDVGCSRWPVRSLSPLRLLVTSLRARCPRRRSQTTSNSPTTVSPSNWWVRTVRGFTSALGNTLFGALPRYPSRVASRCRFKHLPGRCTLSASLRMDPNFSSRTSKVQRSQDHYGVFLCSVARRAAWETPYDGRRPGPLT